MKATRSVGTTIDAERLRFAVLSVLMLLCLAYLVASLHRIQVRDAGLYADAQDAYSFRRVRVPATRGRILDRNGVVLADNKPSYCVAFYIEELRKSGAWSNTVNHVDALLDKVSRIVDRPRDVNREQIAAHITRRRAIPLFAFKGLDEEQMARLAEWPGSLPGTDIYVQSERFYPFGDMASHIIGYVGSGQPREVEEDAVKPEAEEEDFNFYLPDLAGREGIEYACDAELAGRGGGHLIRVNAVGYKHEIIPGKASVSGKDVVLALDAQLQLVAEKALGRNRGAAVVLDCRSGDILAMANSPRYDLRDFVPTLSTATWNRLLKDPAKPLYNRSSSGVYPPGSVLKPVVALCALREGAVDENEIFNCVGSIVVGGRTFNCSHRNGHGEMDLRRAIAVSCNPYFIAAGQRLSYEPKLYGDLHALGFGVAPQIGVQTSSGILPSHAWKRKRFKDSWRGGDTANLSIGQGYLGGTPLQIAIMTAALATDGKVIKPRLIRDAGDGAGVQEALQVSGTMNWSAHNLSIVKGGMYDVLNAPYGTGRRAAIRSVKAGGKTGTAEYLENHVRKKHAWMITFVPFEHPQYAVVAVAEDSDAGGQTAAGIVRQITMKLFNEDPDAEVWYPEEPEIVEPEVPEVGDPAPAAADPAPLDESLAAPETAEPETAAP